MPATIVASCSIGKTHIATTVSSRWDGSTAGSGGRPACCEKLPDAFLLVTLRVPRLLRAPSGGEGQRVAGHQLDEAGPLEQELERATDEFPQASTGIVGPGPGPVVG
jgi:hypothetical protein